MFANSTRTSTRFWVQIPNTERKDTVKRKSNTQQSTAFHTKWHWIGKPQWAQTQTPYIDIWSTRYNPICKPISLIQLLFGHIIHHIHHKLPNKSCCVTSCWYLYEPSFVQTALNYDMLYVIEHSLHIVLVRSTRTMRINVLLRYIPILGFKLFFDEIIAFIKVRSRSSIFRETVRNRFLHNFLFEQIPFIQKQDKWRALKPPRITNLLK